ncbi:hypothetical protein [Rubritalea sp.]|uniref:hypothetical protein n=1 Tax=Rubritalea sp. TaxID=2109375 RepID=UPI003EFABBFB
MKTLFLFLSLSVSLFASTKSVYQIWQPLSLAGTDVHGVVGIENTYAGSVVMVRPMVVSGAIPEDLIAAIALNVPIPSATENYAQPQVNLLAMAKIQLQGRLENGKLVIEFDLSNAVAPEGVELSIENIVELGIEAVQKTVEFNGKAQIDHTFICDVKIVGAKEGSPVTKLNTSFAVEGPKGE